LRGSRDNSATKADYNLLSTRSFLKGLRKLDKTSNRRVLDAIGLLRANPHVGKRLRGQLEGLWSLKVGDLRVIYSVEESTRTVILRAVGHRKAVYER